MRPLFVVWTLTLAALACGSAAEGSSPSWALPQIRIVVAHGLLAKSVATFRPNEPLTVGALSSLQAGLTGTESPPVGDSGAAMTMTQLDAGLVTALGLSAPARQFSLIARAAGLAPPARFGTEVVARMVQLRVNHPAAQDGLELLPSDQATRAEAAYSAARVLAFDGTEAAAVGDSSFAFQLPELALWQRRLLHTAVRFIGYPYVWGGTSENAEQRAGVAARGGFDCSGFVWRVYKHQKYAGGVALAAALHGRTTSQMSGEVPRSRRIAFAGLEPADVVFFGSAGPASKPAQVGHMGIYLGDGWFIHASAQGVYVSTLTGWYRTHFAWARRPLAEAGLVAP